MKAVSKLAVISIIALAASTSQAANLVLNPSFETTTITGPDYTGDGLTILSDSDTRVTDWTSYKNYFMWTQNPTPTGTFPNGDYSIVPQDGDKYIIETRVIGCHTGHKSACA